MDFDPSISGSTVSWTGISENVESFRTRWKIFRWDGSFPIVTTVASAGVHNMTSAASGSNLVWVDRPQSAYGGDRWSLDVFFSDGMTTTRVSELSPSERLRNFQADVSGTHVVWSSCPYGFLPDYGYDVCYETAQIYMATVSIPTPVPSMPIAGLAILSSLLIGTVFLIRFRAFS